MDIDDPPASAASAASKPARGLTSISSFFSKTTKGEAVEKAVAAKYAQLKAETAALHAPKGHGLLSAALAKGKLSARAAPGKGRGRGRGCRRRRRARGSRSPSARPRGAST